jgi:hypothetical protein
MTMILDPIDHLDASLRDFEPSSPPPPSAFGYPSHHSGFLESSREADSESLHDSVSAGGYSPPAWRRLGNGDRSSGFWRKTDNILGGPTPRKYRRDSSPARYDSEDEDDAVLRRAAAIRLPTGSMSPEKGLSPDPDWNEATVKVEDQLMGEMKTPVAENCKSLSHTWANPNPSSRWPRGQRN